MAFIVVALHRSASYAQKAHQRTAAMDPVS
jgi:hypothetical protein